ncbi:hypothetical protein BK138_32840 [Paenibacillus rhizosphaerae]|uniref:Uncharacterized protein n=1 Tax=Paenibacillus rhizosphaerae TaxID=297318 RepID=A0A1R1E4Y6_9BACL|nr:hypothetical protein [Paenibacillus rhizosphaerae]OMF46883.1 hypothetical protein BK138_32840 [Paenibacillus rhizosphaerae]
MKKISALLLAFLLFVLPVAAQAEESNSENSSLQSLSSQEISYLKDSVGLNEEEIAAFPAEKLRTLIDNKAVKVSSKEESFGENSIKGEITPQLNGNDITLQVLTFVQTSDKPGNKKFTLWGYFIWKKQPTFVFSDVMTIGVPQSVGFFLPTNGTNVTQHSHSFVWYDGQNEFTENKTVPHDFSANSGVAGKYNIRNNVVWQKGYIEQNIYIPSGKSGTTNVVLEYGHAVYTLVPSVGISGTTFSIGVSPSSKVETYKIITELKY